MEELKKDAPETNSNQSGSDANASASELDAARKDRDEYLDGWRRAKADLINFKKEEDARLSQLTKFSNESLIAEMLSVLDSFNLHHAALEKAGTVDQGMRMIQGQFENILKKRGLEIISVSKGDAFDPQKHEAVCFAEDGGVSGTIASEIERGYALHGKVIRAARVAVVK